MLLNQLKNLRIDYENDIAIVQLNQENSKVNTLSQEMMNEFLPVFEHLKTNDDIKGIVVISTKPNSFIAGADINMLESVGNRDELYKMSRHGQEIMNQIEQSTKPIVAAIAGSCLGGGFELALACHYRIAINDKQTRFALPEVKLGLIPGAGGTQRILERLSLTDALDLLLTGREIAATRAYALGLIENLIQSTNLRTIAVQKTRELIRQKSFRKQSNFIQNIKSKLISISYLRNYILSQAQSKVLSQTQGLYPAPLRILDVIKQTLEHGSIVGYNAEAEAFADLGMTNESKALIHLFHARTECKKNRYSQRDDEHQCKQIAIIGTGEISLGIGQISIEKDLKVILYDNNSNRIIRSRKQFEQSYEKLIKQKRMTRKQVDDIRSNIIFQSDFNHFEQCDLIIENSFDDLQYKENLRQQVETIISNQCIFACQTSSLSLNQLAKSNSYAADRVIHQNEINQQRTIIGLHYFSPVNRVELVEIIRTSQTSEQTLSSMINFVLKQGKLAVVINDQPGFYTSRLIYCFSLEIFSLLLNGIQPNEIDRVTKKFGFHIGLATLIDEFGIDQIASIGIHRENDIVNELLKIFIRNNWLGRKTQRGLFVYLDKNKKENNRQLNEFIEKKNSHLTTEDIQWRICLRILNEASRCLEENVITCPNDGDIGAVFGFGFPPMKGGPFHFMDTYGLSKIVTLMQNYEIIPTTLLINFSNENKHFYYS